MTLLGKGWPVVGSLATRAFPKKGLVGDSSSLKSPVRIAAVGTVPVARCSCPGCDAAIDVSGIGIGSGAVYAERATADAVGIECTDVRSRDSRFESREINGIAPVDLKLLHLG